MHGNQTYEAGYHVDKGKRQITKKVRHSKDSQADDMMLELKVTDKEIDLKYNTLIRTTVLTIILKTF